MIREDGYKYAFDPSACDTCGGRCCTGESGNIFVNAEEITALAALLSMDVSEFMRDYLVKKGYKYSLREKLVGVSYDCVFFDRANGGCQVYQARPLQCRTFPFWEYYKDRVDELKIECPGVIDDQ